MTFGIEEKLDVISFLETGEEIVGMRRDVGLAHSSVYTVRGNVGRTTENAKSGNKVFV
jgi:hypothetical protein